MKKISINIQRNYFREATIEVEVPSGLTDQEINEYIEEDDNIQTNLDEAVSCATLEKNDDSISFQDVTKEFKIKWEIELDASTPEEAARMALALIQSPDSTAKIFKVDDEFVDLEEIDEEIEWPNIIKEMLPTEPFVFGRHHYKMFTNDKYVLHIWGDKYQFDIEPVISIELSRGSYGDVWYTIDSKE